MTGPVALLPALEAYARSVEADFGSIAAERREQLDRLAGYIKGRRDAGEVARVIYICTHNSRRSQMGQLFATAAAAHYGVDHFEAYSGGTEATAFHPNAVAAIERAGFTVANPGGTNPHYQVRFSAGAPTLEVFSKRYSDPFNPQRDFAAVMTCSQADASCPLVAGASLRVPLHYEDPKASDGTPAERDTYDARAKQIATEAFYVLSRVK